MKSKYIIPKTDVIPCRVDSLLDVSYIPFDPTEGTGEALAKEFTLWDYEIDTEIHYELGQEEGNWYDDLDKWN